MPSNVISVAGANEFNNLLTFAGIVVPTFPDWTINLLNFSALVGNACVIRLQFEEPTSTIVHLPLDQAYEVSASAALAGPTMLGCGIPIPRRANGTLYDVRVVSVGKTTDGRISYTYALGLVTTQAREKVLP